MLEAKGNLWMFPADYRIITTNGTVKKNGESVMGAGCAAEAKRKYPHLAKDLGEMVSVAGNRVWTFPNYGLISFPVKHNWWERADPELISASVYSLSCMAVNSLSSATFVMPRPGCGNGKLSWDDVRPLCLSLPDNVTVITF